LRLFTATLAQLSFHWQGAEKVDDADSSRAEARKEWQEYKA
jgi:hypothetical protein